VLVLEQFLESHIAEAKLGIDAATENLRRLQRALELVLGKSNNSTAGEPVAPVGRSLAPAGDQVVVIVNG
jgi:hypothetical protein